MTQTFRVASRLSFAILVAVAGCRSSTSPLSELDGAWSGNIFSRFGGNGTVKMALVQSGHSITGAWATTFPNGASNNSGTLAGVIVGGEVVATLTSNVSNACPSNVVGSLQGSTLSGDFAAATGCSVPESGTFSVTKR